MRVCVQQNCGEYKTMLEIIMKVDEAFQEIFNTAWPKTLEYFKEVCERQKKI